MRQFGNRATIQDASSELWGWSRWERLLQDIRHGFRALRKTPGFTALAVLTLARGLGINTAVFSVVNGVMLRALPYPDPDRLVSLWEENSRADRPFSSRRTPLVSGPTRAPASVANLADYRTAKSFAGLAAYDAAPMNLTGIGTPERVRGEAVTANYFQVLGVLPAVGRVFTAEEDRPGGDRVVVITDRFWRDRIGADSRVLERSLMLDGRSYRIIGVLPRSFRSPYQLSAQDRIEFYIPAAYEESLSHNRGDHDVNVAGRLNSNVSIEAARSELAAISGNFGKQYPDTNQFIRADIAPLRDDLTRNVRDSMLALLGASGLIVLITCLNVANLLLVRAIGRRHETSVRFALGAGRFRIVRQSIAESVLIAAGGLSVGIFLGNAIRRAILALAPSNIPRIADVSMDWRVFGLATGVATLRHRPLFAHDCKNCPPPRPSPHTLRFGKRSFNVRRPSTPKYVRRSRATWRTFASMRPTPSTLCCCAVMS